jgi:hypothetical protein
MARTAPDSGVRPGPRPEGGPRADDPGAEAAHAADDEDRADAAGVRIDLPDEARVMDDARPPPTGGHHRGDEE